MKSSSRIKWSKIGCRQEKWYFYLWFKNKCDKIISIDHFKSRVTSASINKIVSPNESLQFAVLELELENAKKMSALLDALPTFFSKAADKLEKLTTVLEKSLQKESD